MLDYDGGLTCAIAVTDIEKSIAWYQNIFGFNLLYHAEEIAWCEFTTSVNRVTIGLSQVESVAKGGGASLVWGVKDIDIAKAELAAKGVIFDGELEIIPGMVKLQGFYDPDGNALKIYQDLSNSSNAG
jgi:catechol 2,3-dioxygenase-like lactoylglutathione lyase family enzyme